MTRREYMVKAQRERLAWAISVDSAAVKAYDEYAASRRVIHPKRKKAAWSD